MMSRGRPRKEEDPSILLPADSAPKPVAKKRASVNAKMAQAVVGAIQMVLASLPWTRNDTLSETEQAILTRDVVSFAKANELFARLIVAAFSLTSQAGLPVDVAAMAGVRLANHGVVPLEVGLGASMVLAISAANIQADAADAGPDALSNLFAGLMPSEPTANGVSDETADVAGD